MLAPAAYSCSGKTIGKYQCRGRRSALQSGWRSECSPLKGISQQSAPTIRSSVRVSAGDVRSAFQWLEHPPVDDPAWISPRSCIRGNGAHSTTRRFLPFGHVLRSCRLTRPMSARSYKSLFPAARASPSEPASSASICPTNAVTSADQRTPGKTANPGEMSEVICTPCRLLARARVQSGTTVLQKKVVIHFTSGHTPSSKNERVASSRLSCESCIFSARSLSCLLQTRSHVSLS